VSPYYTKFMDFSVLRKTSPAKWILAPRLVAALPLFVFGSFHLTGMSPLLEILRRAGIPFGEVNLYLAPVFMVLAGLSMGIGFYARIGALIGALAMVVATYSKLVIDVWPGPMEIPLLLPLVVLAGCVVVLVKGPGAWSSDLKAST
jgi:uncharacterized membrane protein YphA (DoxX/SURF4 family)